MISIRGLKAELKRRVRLNKESQTSDGRNVEAYIEIKSDRNGKPTEILNRRYGTVTNVKR